MVYQYDDYRDYLKDTLDLRKKRNRSYSMRAFAKALGVPVSTLSEVTNKKKHLSLEAARKVAGGLRFRVNEKRYFSLLVEMESTRNSARRKEIQIELKSLAQQSLRKGMDANYDEFLNQSDKFVLIELGGIENFILNSKTGAVALGKSREEVQEHLSTLKRLEVLTQSANKDQYLRSGSGVLISSDKINLDLRRFHLEMLDKAKASLAEQSPRERLVGSETFSFCSNQLNEANDIMEEFFSKMVGLANRSTNKDSVYHVGLQMFRLAKAGSQS